VFDTTKRIIIRSARSFCKVSLLTELVIQLSFVIVEESYWIANMKNITHFEPKTKSICWRNHTHIIICCHPIIELATFAKLIAIYHDAPHYFVTEYAIMI